MFYMVWVELTHPNPIHYNNRPTKIIKVNFFYEGKIIKNNIHLQSFMEI